MTAHLSAFLADREQRTLRMRRRPARGRLRARRRRSSSERVAAGQTDRAAPPRRSRAARPRQRRSAWREENIERHRLAHPRLPDRGPPRLPSAPDAHRRRGGRGDPRGRRRCRLGASLLGHRGPRRSARPRSTASSHSAWTASRPSTSPTTGSRRSCSPARCAEAGAALDRLRRLPRPRNRCFPSFLAFETFGLTPNLGRIARTGLDSAHARRSAAPRAALEASASSASSSETFTARLSRVPADELDAPRAAGSARDPAASCTSSSVRSTARTSSRAPSQMQSTSRSQSSARRSAKVERPCAPCARHAAGVLALAFVAFALLARAAARARSSSSR